MRSLLSEFFLFDLFLFPLTPRLSPAQVLSAQCSITASDEHWSVPTTVHRSVLATENVSPPQVWPVHRIHTVPSEPKPKQTSPIDHKQTISSPRPTTVTSPKTISPKSPSKPKPPIFPRSAPSSPVSQRTRKSFPQKTSKGVNTESVPRNRTKVRHQKSPQDIKAQKQQVEEELQRRFEIEKLKLELEGTKMKAEIDRYFRIQQLELAASRLELEYKNKQVQSPSGHALQTIETKQNSAEKTNVAEASSTQPQYHPLFLHRMQPQSPNTNVHKELMNRTKFESQVSFRPLGVSLEATFHEQPPLPVLKNFPTSSLKRVPAEDIKQPQPPDKRTSDPSAKFQVLQKLVLNPKLVIKSKTIQDSTRKQGIAPTKKFHLSTSQRKPARTILKRNETSL